MAIESLAYTYTTKAEMQRVFSAAGVDIRLDDLDDHTAALNEFIGEATDIVNYYCSLYYDEVDLETSYTVHRWATWIACHLLSQRRGNSSIFQRKYEEILGWMEEVANGERIIPRLPTREDFTPAMANIHVDDRFRVHKLRVHPTISTGGIYGKQDLSPRFPFEWLVLIPLLLFVVL